MESEALQNQQEVFSADPEITAALDKAGVSDVESKRTLFDAIKANPTLRNIILAISLAGAAKEAITYTTPNPDHSAAPATSLQVPNPTLPSHEEAQLTEVRQTLEAIPAGPADSVHEEIQEAAETGN